jgi:F-type H+-transporting ATPase subunit b
MRRAILLLVLMLFPIALSATDQQGQVASGAEKEAHQIAHPHENHGEGSEAPKTYFGIPGWILKVANMLLFIGVLGYFVGGPVKKAFAERSEAIRTAASEARSHRQKADQLASDIQARLTQIELDVKAIHERAVAEGERQKRELIAAAEVEAQKILQTATNEVDNRLKHARHELTEYAGQLAAERAEAILKERITPADQEKLFQDSLRQVEGARS